MKKVFALLHKPSFWSLTQDALCGIFETEDDALEALETERHNLRKPYVKSYDLVSAEDWKIKKLSLTFSESTLDGKDGPYDYDKYPRPTYGLGTSRSRGRGYR